MDVSKLNTRSRSEQFVSCLIVVILSSAMYISKASFQGLVSPASLFDVDVDFSKIISTNNLSLGVQIGQEWQAFVKEAELRNRFVDCNFRIVRFFVHHTQPCTSWDEVTRTGTYDWSRFDQEVQTLQQLNAKMLIAIGHNAADGLPKGMDRNFKGTGFPNPESFADYCKEIALHLRSNGWNIEYWEPYNEPNIILQCGTLNETSYDALVDLFNLASDAVIQVLPSAMFGIDVSKVKSFLDRFAHDSQNVGFLSFHKYDAGATPMYNPDMQVNNDQILQRAGNLGRCGLTPQQMTDEWYNLTGVTLPVFCTETNMNSAYIGGTDPRIQDIVGGVWYAEELRAFVLSNVCYSVYYHLASDDSPMWETSKQTKGYGFGMAKSTAPHLLWYPCLVNLVIGSNLNVGDKICSCSTSNPTDLSALAWVNNGSYNILLIGKTNLGHARVRVNTENVNLDENAVSILKIDGDSSQLQTLREGFTNPFVVSTNGYFVVLLKFS